LPNNKISKHHYCGGKKWPNPISLIHDLAIILVGFAGLDVLNQDPTVWLDGTRLANTCIPPIPGECTHAATWHIYPPKCMCKYAKTAVKIA